MQGQYSVQQWASVLYGLTGAAIVALTFAITLLLVMLSPDALIGATYRGPVAPEASAWHIYAAMAVGLLKFAILLWCLWVMRQLFANYRRGLVLTDTCARLIKRLGFGFMALALAPLLIQPLQTLLMTLANPPGAHAISFSLSSEMIFFALAGGLILVIGNAMHAAADAAQENRSFV